MWVKRVHLGMRPTAPLQKISLGRSNGRPSLSRQARWAERLATLAIILIARPKGLNDTLKQAQEDPHGPSVRVDNEASD